MGETLLYAIWSGELRNASNWIVVGALALPHLLYAFIWYMPELWMKTFQKRSVEVFETCAWLLKSVQFSSVVLWFVSNKDATRGGAGTTSIPPVAGVIGLALMVLGQTLNAGTYKAIGHVGVYYGFKLGHAVPWVDGFPFSVVAHPQYVGSVLSVWGAAVMWWTQAPDGLGLLVGYWTLLYVFTGIMEH